MSKLQLKLQIPLEKQYEAAEKIHRGELLLVEDLADFLGIPTAKAFELMADHQFSTFVHNVRMAATRFEFDAIAPKKLREIVVSPESKPSEAISAINVWADLAFPNRRKNEVNVNITLESVLERTGKVIDIEGHRFPGVDEE